MRNLWIVSLMARKSSGSPATRITARSPADHQDDKESDSIHNLFCAIICAGGDVAGEGVIEWMFKPPGMT